MIIQTMSSYGETRLPKEITQGEWIVYTDLIPSYPILPWLNAPCSCVWLPPIPAPPPSSSHPPFSPAGELGRLWSSNCSCTNGYVSIHTHPSSFSLAGRLSSLPLRHRRKPDSWTNQEDDRVDVALTADSQQLKELSFPLPARNCNSLLSLGIQLRIIAAHSISGHME